MSGRTDPSLDASSLEAIEPEVTVLLYGAGIENSLSTPALSAQPPPVPDVYVFPQNPPRGRRQLAVWKAWRNHPWCLHGIPRTLSTRAIALALKAVRPSPEPGEIINDVLVDEDGVKRLLGRRRG